MKQNKKIMLFISIVVMILVISTGFCIDYYVDVNGGNNANSGLDWDNAYSTIGHAASVTIPGDHIRINHGRYREQITAPPSGTQTNPILYEGIGNVEIDGENIRNHGFHISARHWLTIKNITVKFTRSHAIYIDGDGIVIENCAISDSGHTDSTWSVLKTSNGDDCIVRQCRFINNDHGLYLDRGARNVFDRNTIVSTQNTALRYNNDGNSTRENKVINNLTVNNNGIGIQLDSYNLTTDVVAKNNSFQNSPNWRLNGGDADDFTDNLNLDPQFIGETQFLNPSSPMIEAGYLNQGGSQIPSVGALGIGHISSQTQNSWTGWIDQNGNPVSTSLLVGVDNEGNIQLKNGVSEAALLSPVVNPSGQASLQAIRIDAVQAQFLPSGEKQVIDSDNTSPTPEIRYRVSNTQFTQT